MFNFNLMNKALTDVNLSDKEFRLLYLIVNNMSMNDTNEIEMYNGFIMDRLGISERQVQRVTKGLVEKGYITKVVTGSKTNRNGNVIRLNDAVVIPSNDDSDTNGDINSDMDCDKSCDKNVTPYNSIKEYKDISMDKDHDEEATPQVKLSRDEYRQRNDFISSVYRKLDTKLDELFAVKTPSGYTSVSTEINTVLREASDHTEYFTAGQLEKLQWYKDRFFKLCKCKDRYFKDGAKMNADATVTSTDDTPLEQADDVSVFTDDEVLLADRLTYPQPFEDSTPPSSAAPPLMEWLDGINKEIRKGIFDWSLTLTDDDVETDDATKIVSDVLRNHPEWETYKGQFSILELTKDVMYKMENRLNNKDVAQIIRHNRMQKRHDEYRKELNA